MKISHPLQLLFLVCLLLSGFWFACRSLTALLLIAATAVTVSAVFSRQVFHVFSLTKLMLIYIVWLFVVAYISAIPSQSMMLLAVLACLPVVYIVASNTVNFVEIWRPFSIVLFLAGIGLAISAIWQVQHHFQAEGPLNDRNAFAALINLLWFPATYLFLSTRLTTKTNLKILLGIGLFIISLALFATSSRGGLLSWLLLLPVMLWVAYKQVSSKKLILALLAIIVMAYLCSAKVLHSDILDRTFKVGPSSQAGELSKDPSTSARLMLWQSTINIAKDNPVFGTGWGTFVAYYPAYRSPLEFSTYGSFTHNDYLQIASEGGFTALIILLIILVKLSMQLRSNIIKNEDANFYAVALLLGVLAIFVQASVNFIFYYAFMNILAGLFLAYIAKTTEIPTAINITYFQQIKPVVKRLIVATTLLLIATPYLVNLVATLCLDGNAYGLKSVNKIAPQLTPYKIANFIAAVYPKEATAQLTLLDNASSYLINNVNAQGNATLKQNLLINTLNRFDYVRKQNALSPNLGLQQLELVMAYHQVLDAQLPNGNSAYALAHRILADNLKADPNHIKSMIALARLQAIEGSRKAAFNTLQVASTKTHDLLYQQLVIVEILRLRAAPNKIPELNQVERLLDKAALINKLPDEQAILPDNFYDEIDAVLDKINTQLINNNQ